MILMPPLSATVQELKQMVDIIKVAISVVRASKSVDENISNTKSS
jgi:adenosylmethionine-8-amino-7-oxononanoate aminotransferase